MSTNIPIKRGPGRPPTGRVTKQFTMRMESSIKDRLVAAATSTRPMNQIVEKALDKALPPLKEHKCP